jgi:hypothetical protein
MRRDLFEGKHEPLVRASEQPREEIPYQEGPSCEIRYYLSHYSDISRNKIDIHTNFERVFRLGVRLRLAKRILIEGI